MSVSGNIYAIPTPYVLYCGDSDDITQVKVARGVVEWARHKVSAVYKDRNRLIPEAPHVDALMNSGATLVIGLAPFGGAITQDIVMAAMHAISCGLNVAAGLHSKLADVPELVDAADKAGVKLYDFRHRPDAYPLGTGLSRAGVRCLTVGTDCACGKKYTALTLHREAQARIGDAAVFCSTGQTGFLISNSGINNDTITADFLAGAAESLSPDSRDSLYFIEGQGSIEHPAYCGGSLSLLAGSRPDFLIVCHEHLASVRKGTSSPIRLRETIINNLTCARMFGLTPIVLAISVNFSKANFLYPEQKAEALRQYEAEYPDVLVFDPSESSPALDSAVSRLVSAHIEHMHSGLNHDLLL